MNYNDFCYYRANPYANQGYMPPIAHLNRHRPNFLTQIPMGQQHLHRIGKRQYGTIQRSNIESENILKSPQRYPFQNRIALQKTYERNMNTIDIQGATSGSLMSQAVRNKLRARQQLIRKQRQSGKNLFQQLQHIQTTQQEKKRQIAHQQYMRNQQILQLNAGRLSKISQDYVNQSIDVDGRSYQMNNNYHQNRPKSQRRAHNGQKINQNSYQQLSRPRYQSIQHNRSPYNPETDHHKTNTSLKQKLNDIQLSTSQVMMQEQLNRNNNINQTQISNKNRIYLAGKYSLL